LTGHFEGDVLEKDKRRLREEGFVHHDRLIEKPLTGMLSHKFKTKVCRAEKIDVLFEDSPEVVEEVNKTKEEMLDRLHRELGATLRN